MPRTATDGCTSKGKHVGDRTMGQVSVGLQAGGQVYSQIIFFENQRSFDIHVRQLQVRRECSAVAITAAAGASAGTIGTCASASGGKNDAVTLGQFHKGIAVSRSRKAA